MVTDRVSTCGLLVIVSHLYPKYMFHFAMLIVLDITSHWFHVMSVSAHHKSKEALEHRNALLQWYYSIYPLFGYCCVGTELFYVLLYVIHHFPNPMLSNVSPRIVFDGIIDWHLMRRCFLDLFLRMLACLCPEAAGESRPAGVRWLCHRRSRLPQGLTGNSEFYHQFSFFSQIIFVVK